MNPLLVLSTFPDAKTAREITRTLVDERLVACGNLLPGVESIYRWKGAVESAAEVMAIYKTTRSAYPALEERLKSLHPYEVPELVALTPSGGWPPYLAWIVENTRG